MCPELTADAPQRCCRLLESGGLLRVNGASSVCVTVVYSLDWHGPHGLECWGRLQRVTCETSRDRHQGPCGSEPAPGGSLPSASFLSSSGSGSWLFLAVRTISGHSRLCRWGSGLPRAAHGLCMPEGSLCLAQGLCPSAEVMPVTGMAKPVGRETLRRLGWGVVASQSFSLWHGADACSLCRAPLYIVWPAA